MNAQELFGKLASGESFADLYAEAMGSPLADAPKTSVLKGWRFAEYTEGRLYPTEEMARAEARKDAFAELESGNIEEAAKAMRDAKEGELVSVEEEVTDFTPFLQKLSANKGKRGAKVSSGPKRLNKPLEESLAGNVVLAIADLGGAIEVADREGGGNVFSYTLPEGRTYRDLLNTVNRRRHAIGFTEPLPSVSVPAMLAAVHSHKPEVFGDPDALAIWHAQVS